MIKVFKILGLSFQEVKYLTFKRGWEFAQPKSESVPFPRCPLGAPHGQPVMNVARPSGEGAPSGFSRVCGPCRVPGGPDCLAFPGPLRKTPSRTPSPVLFFIAIDEKQQAVPAFASYY